MGLGWGCRGGGYSGVAIWIVAVAQAAANKIKEGSKFAVPANMKIEGSGTSYNVLGATAPDNGALTYQWTFADNSRDGVTISGSSSHLEALKQAIMNAKGSAGLVHHSDHGSQYTSIKYSEKLADYGIKATT